MKIKFSILIFVTFYCLQAVGQVANKINTIAVPEGAFNFIVIGDWGRNGDYNQKEVANGLRKMATKCDPEFFVSTGDNFYPSGVVSTSDPLWKYSFEDIYTGADLQKQWNVVLGNHDYQGNPQAEIDYSSISRRWNMPARYFTQVVEVNKTDKVRMIYLDTNPFVTHYRNTKGEYGDIDRQDTSAQLRWLDSLLALNDSKWKVVVGHHPVYSSSKKHGDTKELIQKLKPRFEKSNVQLYLCGHDHDLQHNMVESKVNYVVSGAGSEVRKTSNSSYTKFVSGVPGFAVVYLKDDTIFLQFVNQEGNVIYSYKQAY